MKNITRWSLGLLSTCSLAVGLVRAADRLDPVNRELNALSKAALEAPTPDCVTACFVAESPAPDCVTACFIASDLN